MTVFLYLFGIILARQALWRDSINKIGFSLLYAGAGTIARAAESPIAVGVHSSMEISGIVTTEARVEINRPLAM